MSEIAKFLLPHASFSPASCPHCQPMNFVSEISPIHPILVLDIITCCPLPPPLQNKTVKNHTPSNNSKTHGILHRRRRSSLSSQHVWWLVPRDGTSPCGDVQARGKGPGYVGWSFTPVKTNPFRPLIQRVRISLYNYSRGPPGTFFWNVVWQREDMYWTCICH